MGKYIYKWDSINKKKVYGGKYPEITQQDQEYTFSDTIHGTHTFTASSYPDALRQAESMGYTASDYKKRKKR